MCAFIWWSKMAKRQRKKGNLIHNIFFNATKSTPPKRVTEIKKRILSFPVVKFVMAFYIEGIWDRYLIKYFYDPYSKEVGQNAMLSVTANEIISICCAISNQRRRRQRQQWRHKMKIKRELDQFMQTSLGKLLFVMFRSSISLFVLYSLVRPYIQRTKWIWSLLAPRNRACKIFLFSAKYS